MKKKNSALIVAVVIFAIILAPIISNYFSTPVIEAITESEVLAKVDNVESFILYNGKKDKKTLRKLGNLIKMKSVDALTDYNVYILDGELTDENIKNQEVVIYIDGDIQKTISKFDVNEVTDSINSYYLGVFDKNNIYYKTADNFSAYKKIVNNDIVTMSVFGRNSCSWCNKFKPVYNAVAEKYNIDIYYFDSDSYNSSDYKKIINMDLTVPAKCSSNEQEFKLSDGFGTPLSIFTKNGEIVDCISGYLNRANLIQRLKDNGIISEE